MCSITEATPAPVTVRALSMLANHAVEAVRAFADALVGDPSLLAEVPDELLEQLALRLHTARDAAEASATVVTGRVDRCIGDVRGKLVAGKYVSTTQFLVAEAGMSPLQARATVGRGRALHHDYTEVADGWLAGRITGGAIKPLTQGVDQVLRRSSRRSNAVTRESVLADLLPLAEARDLPALEHQVRVKRLEVDPDGCDEEALFAFESQRLSIVENGTMWRISGDLTAEVAAATLTVLEAAAATIVAEQVGEVDHDAGCEVLLVPGSGCTCGELDRARRAQGLHHPQVLARALGEVMTDQLDDGVLGSHHRVAPHLTGVSDITDATAPVIGRMAVPGSNDDVLLPPATMSRLLCDADITRVLTTHAGLLVAADPGAGSDAQSGFLRAVTTSLAAMARNVLYVGRSQRTVSARLRRALETRDGHCAFPGCRAHVRRCHAHHVVPWEHGGPTSIDNLALLCVTHHPAVHEGGWIMQLADGATGHETGCWDFTPPPLRRRRLQP
jgi:hypothetical protein